MYKKDKFAKKGSTLFLRGVILLIGAGVLAICVFVLPHGIAAENDGYYRPIFLGLYVSAVPFFLVLYQTLKLLHYIDKNTAFSDLSVQSLKTIKYCAVTISTLFTIGLPYIYYAANRDDAPGVLALALVIILASAAIAVFTAVLQRLLKNAIDVKLENELTV